MNIYFFNPCRNGDVHVSRSFIIDIMNKLPNNQYYYIQNPNYTSEFILKDIKGIKPSVDNTHQLNSNSSITQIGDDLFINTWYGQSDFKYFEISMSINKADDCSFYILYNIFIDVYKFLEIEIDTFENYLPSIIYDNIDKINIDNFFQNNIFEKYILICDNPVQSGQSLNFNFKPIVEELSLLYKDIAFITTSYNIIKRENLFSTNDIIQLKFDLNEISYLSNRCDVIIGRGSGPYTFCLTKENLMNNSKKFVAFTNNKIVALGLKDNDHKCKLNWSNDYNHNSILNKIIEFI